MARSFPAVCRCLGEKRHVNDAEMTRRGVAHLFKLDPLGGGSTWPRSVISTHLMRVLHFNEPGNAAVGCCQTYVRSCDFLFERKEAVSRALSCLLLLSCPSSS